MANASDGMTYNPGGQDKPVVESGEFMFGVAALDHAHIGGMTTALESAGAQLKRIYEPNWEKAEAFQKVPSSDNIQQSGRAARRPEIRCVAAAAIPSVAIWVSSTWMPERTTSRINALYDFGAAGSSTRKSIETGRKYMVYFSERFHNAPTFFAGELARSGAIGKVLQIIVMALSLEQKQPPGVVFKKSVTVALSLTSAVINSSNSSTSRELRMPRSILRVENFNNPDNPELEDFGETSMTMDNGASCYCRIDWFTPEAARAWGDGRLFALGTEG